MKKLGILIVIVALVTGMMVGVVGQEKKVPAKPAAGDTAAKADKPAGIVAEEFQMTAVVKAVDQAKREVTLAMPGGEIRTYTAGPEVKNLAQVKVGDQVKVTYIQSVAIAVREAKEPPAAENATTVKLAAKGAKPGAFVANTQTITAKVTAIDHKTRVITLTGPKGNSLTFTVGPDVKKLDQVKQGDEVVVSYTESLLVDVVEAAVPAAPVEPKAKK